MRKQNKKLAFTVIELSVVILIIAFVIAMALGSRSIITAARLSTLRSISAKSPVYDIADNVLWYDISAKRAFTTYPNNNNLVSSISDVSPNLPVNINMVQLNSDSQPKFVFDTIDGLPYLYFDGVNDFLTSSRLVYGYELAQPNQMTIIIVNRHFSGSNRQFDWGFGTNNRILSHATHSDNRYYYEVGAQASGRIISSVLASAINSWKIVTMVKKTNGTGFIKANGVPVLNQTSMTSNLNVNDSRTFYMGEGRFDLREFMIFKRELSSAEIADIENYLSLKWKIDID